MSGAKKSSIIIPNTLFRNFDFLAGVVYGVLQDVLKSGKGLVLVTPEMVADRCGIKLTQSKKRKEFINAFEDLCDLSYFKKDGKDYFVDTDLFYKWDGYETCDIAVFNKLKYAPELLRHYLLIKKGLINGKCTYSISYFEKNENASRSTITRRNKELEDMKLIYIMQTPYNFETKTGSKNVYMLYNADKETGQINYANENRRVAQRYNSFVKHPEKFTPLTKKVLRQEVEQYNERNPDRIKDMSVFD